MKQQQQSDNDVNNKQTQDEEEEVEIIDDWGLGGSGSTTEDTTTSYKFHLFAQHEQYTVYIPLYPSSNTTAVERNADSNTTLASHQDPTTVEVTNYSTITKETLYKKFHLLCVESLTPIDMMNMSNGVHDSTGHCVWTGSFLLIAALSTSLLRPFFNHKNIIELGCGTGISSIALLQLQLPKAIVLTDGDPEAIKLSTRNCILNEHSITNIDNVDTENDDKGNKTSPEIFVTSLYWGNNDDLYRIRSLTKLNFDTVFATDVLYDIGLLPSLLETACNCLRLRRNNNDNEEQEISGNNSSGQRYFILSHVPRACYTSSHLPSKLQTLEELIIESAQTYNFQLEQWIRPLEIVSYISESLFQFPRDALNNIPLHEMQDIGASIFIFTLSSS